MAGIFDAVFHPDGKSVDPQEFARAVEAMTRSFRQIQREYEQGVQEQSALDRQESSLKDTGPF